MDNEERTSNSISLNILDFISKPNNNTLKILRLRKHTNIISYSYFASDPNIAIELLVQFFNADIQKEIII